MFLFPPQKTTKALLMLVEVGCTILSSEEIPLIAFLPSEYLRKQESSPLIAQLEARQIRGKIKL